MEVSNTPAAAAAPWSAQTKLPGIKRTVAVASGKGGVGKSTVSVNLARALRHSGGRSWPVGLRHLRAEHSLDDGSQRQADRKRVGKAHAPVPARCQVDEYGFRLVEDDAPVIWRGPMIMKAIQQFITEVDWAPLDYLLVDLACLGDRRRATLSLPKRFRWTAGSS